MRMQRVRAAISKRSLIMAIGFALLMVLLMGPTARPAQAAACTTPSTDYGMGTISVNIPSTATYRIWSRIKAPDANNNSYLLEIDGNTCFTVGDSAIAANTWTWVDYQNGTTSSKISASLSAGTHSLKLIGREPGVLLSQLLFLSDTSCTPTGNGDNCAASDPGPTPIVVPTSGYAWQFAGMTIMDEGQNSPIRTDFMNRGERLFVRVNAKNTGTATWYRDTGHPIRLGTQNPQDRYTPYCDVTWPASCNRAGTLEEATVAPGQTGHFGFYMAVPNDPGEYRTFFKPVVEGISWMNDVGFNIYVRDNRQYDWKWMYFDAYTDSSKTTHVDMKNLARNQQVYLELKIANLSATIWKNNGANPTRLGTQNPQDHNSFICASGWLSCNRPALMQESSVVPGQLATFGFTIKAPNANGEYREYLKPLIEFKGWMRDDPNHIYMRVTH